MHGQNQDGGRRGGKYVCTVPALPRRPVGGERDSAALLENPVHKGSERGRKGFIFGVATHDGIRLVCTVWITFGLKAVNIDQINNSQLLGVERTTVK